MDNVSRVLRGLLVCALLLGAGVAKAARAQELRAPSETRASGEAARAPAATREAAEFRALLEAAARLIQAREFEQAERAIERASTFIRPAPAANNARPATPPATGARTRDERSNDSRASDGHATGEHGANSRTNNERAASKRDTNSRAGTARARALREHRASAVAFHRGLLALGRGEHLRAADIFHAMLARDPRLLRVRLEFARALFLARRDRAARREFERVLAARPPAVVARNVQRFLGAIRRRRAWSADFTFALLPDSNLNQGPSTRVVEIGGLPFTLADSARETSGLGAHLQLASGARLRTGERWRLAANGRASRREYAGHRYDDMTLAASIGPRWLHARGEVGGALQLARRSFGGRSYSREVGVRASALHALTPRRQLGLSASATWLRHEREDVRALRDGPHFALGLHWREGLRANSTLSFWLRYRRERPRVRSLRNRAPTLGIGWTHDFARGITLGLEAQAAFTHFDAPHTLFGTRRDRTLIGTLRLRKRDLLLRGFAPVLAYTHIRNHSTHSTRRYARNLLELSLRRAF